MNIPCSNSTFTKKTDYKLTYHVEFCIKKIMYSLMGNNIIISRAVIFIILMNYSFKEFS